MQDLPVILFGVGGVGRSFLRQVIEHRSFHALQYNLNVRVLAVCDSDGALIEPNEGLDDDVLQEVLQLKEQGKRLTEHLQGGPQGGLSSIVDIAGSAGTVVVDCTATDATVDALLFALERGYKIALANKKPLTAAQEVYDRLTTAGATQNGQPVRQLSHSRWETTVGAGLPIIAALNRLFAAGDAVERITGAFSGTLGYVMTGLQEGRSFSEIVREAHKLGYTEPDPRDDLGGVDVARKALILARGLGWRLDMAQVSVEGLYPPEMDKLSVHDFMAALPELDAQFAAQVQAAANEGKVLRFAATIEGDDSGGHCSAGPVMVEASSPLGRLTGTDNLVEFHSRWYNPNPLVIQGRGAGADATAAGVLSDVIELAYTA